MCACPLAMRQRMRREKIRRKKKRDAYRWRELEKMNIKRHTHRSSKVDLTLTLFNKRKRLTAMANPTVIHYFVSNIH